MLRREFIQWSVLSLGMLGCRRDDYIAPGDGVPVIDIHCHVFNASDLATTRFLKEVVLEKFPEQAARLMDVRDPDVTDRLLQLFLLLVGANKAPTADQEITYLRGRAQPVKSAISITAARESAIDDTAAFLLSLDQRSGTSAVQSAARQAQDEGDRKFLTYMLGETTIRRSSSGLDAPTARNASVRAFSGLGMISTYLNWFALFRTYRHVLVEQLSSDLRRQGFEPVMLCPALVDMDEWLYEDVKSPLSRQAEVMGIISARMARKNEPVVHGYIGVDPLREVMHRIKGGTSSLQIAHDALTRHGFMGVKLYPPMGFRASGNRGPYPRRVVNSLGFDPSERLDAALRDLYVMCDELDAPIIAHGYASNEAGPDYALRADPAYWLPVFREFPRLRICLAHFGRFDIKSAGRAGRDLPEASWEWVLGEYIKANPRQRIFVDISYFSEALNDSRESQARLAATFKRWITAFDPSAEHVMFGTDWIMLGKEQGYEQYVTRLQAFLRDQCGLSDAQLERIFRRNAETYLPLQAGSAGRRRLQKFYQENGLDEGRLPVNGGWLQGLLRRG